jgi:hypothetical protein
LLLIINFAAVPAFAQQQDRDRTRDPATDSSRDRDTDRERTKTPDPERTHARDTRAPQTPLARSELVYGWELMSAQERATHRKTMLAAKTAAERQKLREEHRQQMEARAHERGVQLADPHRMELRRRQQTQPRGEQEEESAVPSGSGAPGSGGRRGRPAPRGGDGPQR